MSADHHDPSSGSQDARRHALDHQTRDRWLDRDDRLAKAWRDSKLSREQFVRDNAEMIDQVIAERGG